MDDRITAAMPVQGLTGSEAAARLVQEGPNVLPERRVRGPLRIFIAQFRSPFIYMPLPLFPLQLLWLNLVTNGIQHIALVMEPEEGHELSRAPRSPGEPIFNRLMAERVLVSALVMGPLAFAVFTWQLNAGAEESSARNMTLLLMVLFENVHVLNSRSETISVFRQGLFGNRFVLLAILGAQVIHIGSMYTPGLRDLLEIMPVTTGQWAQLLVVALILIVMDEAHKYLRARHVAWEAR